MNKIACFGHFQHFSEDFEEALGLLELSAQRLKFSEKLSNLCVSAFVYVQDRVQEVCSEQETSQSVI